MIGVYYAKFRKVDFSLVMKSGSLVFTCSRSIIIARVDESEEERVCVAVCKHPLVDYLSNCQIKICQNFLLAYNTYGNPVPNRQI